MKIVGLILLAVSLMLPAQADWKESLNNALDNTGDLTQKTIEKTKQYGDQALQGSKDFYGTLSDGVSLFTAPESQLITKPIVRGENSQHLKSIWPDVLENLDDALNLNTKIDTAPTSRWFGEDKPALRKKQFELFGEIETLLSSPAISANRKNIDRLKGKIYDERQYIASLKEKRVVATRDEKTRLDKKIKTSLGKITEYTTRIDIEKTNLKIRLQESGLLLNDGQIDVLLSRVDADDIIKMSVVYDVLADITRQLMELTQEFNEDIHQARKYYGMHVVLLKFVINMQQTYINKLDKEYLPRINKIRKDTMRINQESRQLLHSENNQAQRSVLQNNLHAQQLTLKVAKLYAQQLGKQKAKVVEALNRAKSDYRVAKNTFDTVKLSAELIRLMKTNEASFNALMNIQIPEIVPFQNIEMQKKFEELSGLLKK